MSDRNTVLNELDSLIDYLTNFDEINKNRNSKHLGVLSGMSGIWLVLIDILKENPKREIKDKAEKIFNRIIEILESSESLMFTYCDGLAGFGILLEKIKRLELYAHSEEKSDFIDDLLSQIDDITNEELDNLLIQENFDFLHGAVGLGLYLLERNDEVAINKLVKKLTEKAIVKENEAYWIRYDKYHYHTTVIDLGIAHGNSSIIMFLVKVLKKYDIKGLKELIYKNIQFYINNKQDIRNEIYSYYPPTIIHSEYLNKNNLPRNSRLAWCYGDLGVFYSLFLISKELNFQKEEELFLEHLFLVADRKNDPEEYTMDAAFCHGSSGIAIIFQRLYQITNFKKFEKVAKFWLETTLESKNAESNKINDIGYSFPISNSKEHNISLLEGATGLLYCYGKFLNYKTVLTDEFLFLRV